MHAHVCGLFLLARKAGNSQSAGIENGDLSRAAYSFLPSPVQIALSVSQSSFAANAMIKHFIGVLSHGYLPLDVVGMLQAPRLRHFVARDRERVVPQGPVAKEELLAKSNLERKLGTSAICMRARRGSWPGAGPEQCRS